MRGNHAAVMLQVPSNRAVKHRKRVVCKFSERQVGRCEASSRPLWCCRRAGRQARKGGNPRDARRAFARLPTSWRVVCSGGYAPPAASAPQRWEGGEGGGVVRVG